MRRLTLLVAPLMAATLVMPAQAEEIEGGELNPEELSLNYFMRKLERGETDPIANSAGYLAAKSGDYATARRIFEPQAAAGNTQAMTWLSWMEDNGLGAPENAERAAEWDRKAAELGDSVAMFNYGLDLLRGRGVEKSAAKGRAMIDRAASAGDDTAQELQRSGYDVDAVTPDADAWKYDRRLY
ncbi:MAG: sel1 repeat family protein [Neomegalonema sp.]|nr:sel1 repeat family protein [Neomegalonema sp.]